MRLNLKRFKHHTQTLIALVLVIAVPTASAIPSRNISITNPTAQQQQTGQTSGRLNNRFDKEAVQKELELQTQITQNFDKNRQRVRAHLKTKEQQARAQAEALSKKAKEAKQQGDIEQAEQLSQASQQAYSKAKQWQNGTLVFDSISSGLYGGSLAHAANPYLAQKIGNYFKNQQKTNTTQHILAHAALGAAIAAASGDNPLTAGASAAASEAAAPLLAKWLYGTKDPRKLSAEQQATVSNIASLAGTALGASAGTGQAIAGHTQIAKSAVENNYLWHAEAMTLDDLERKKVAGKCDEECIDKIAELKNRSAKRDNFLRGCKGVISPACNKAAKQVRLAAAEYIRINQFVGARPTVTTYSYERNHAKNMALDTMDGSTAAAVVKVLTGEVVTTAKGFGALFKTLYNGALRPDQARKKIQESISKAPGAFYRYIKTPENWKSLFGAATAQEREALAQAYERGDYEGVTKFMVNRAANLPLPSKLGRSIVQGATKKVGANVTRVVGGGFVLGKGGIPGSPKILRNITTVLSKPVMLSNGKKLPVGTRVVVRDDAMKVTTPDGKSFRGSYSKLTASQPKLPYYGSKKNIPKYIQNTLSKTDAAAFTKTLKHIDSKTVPSGHLSKKWGSQFKNLEGELPGAKGSASPYLEYRVAPSVGQKGAGTNRIVVNSQTGEVYYTWTHYGTSGNPAFVKFR